MPLLETRGSSSAFAYGLNGDSGSDLLYTNLNTFLLSTSSTNGLGNNSFIDSGPSAITVTSNNNPSQGSFTPFLTHWSAYFDGSSSYASSNTAALAFGTGDFTFETWLRALPMASAFASPFGASATGGFLFNVTGSNGSLPTGIAVNAYGTGPHISGTYAFDSTWTHVAYSRASGVGRFFVNGALIASGADTVNYASTAWSIGSAGTTVQPYAGEISDVRVIKGTAIYTANFAVPTTQLTAITNTSVLTCQSNRPRDNSANAYTITLGHGAPKIVSGSPYAKTVAYSPAVHGGSVFFNNSGLAFASSDIQLLQAGNNVTDFMCTSSSGVTATFEAWVYPTEYTFQGQSYQFSSIYAKDSVYMNWGVKNGKLSFYWWTGAPNNFDSNSANDVPLNQWTHVMTTFNGSTITHYINGVASGSTSSYVGVQAAGANTQDWFGYEGAGTYFVGYVSDVRISNTLRSVPSFTSPVGVDANTKVKLGFSNIGVFDATSNVNLELRNAVASTAVSRFGGSSLAFPGTSSSAQAAPFLTTRSNQATRFDRDFTVEFWYYPTNVGAAKGGVGQALFDTRIPSNANTTAGFAIYNSSANNKITVASGGSSQINSTTSPVNNTWYHIALSRVGSSIRLFINGVQEGSTWTSSTAFTDSYFLLGGVTDNTAGSYMKYEGYLDEVRVTNGFGRYSSSFNPLGKEFNRL
jgi:hypothetical protein